MSRDLQSVFQRARTAGKAALVGYLPAGFPTPAQYLEIVQTAASSGLDILEIGLPVEEPYLDGPVIRSALQTLLQQGITVDRALEIGAEALLLSKMEGIAMAYSAAMKEYGVERLLARCHALGIAGVLLVGSTLSEWVDFARLARQMEVQPVGFLGSQADEQSLEKITRCSQGFLYVQSYDGQTGERGEFGEALEIRLRQARKYTRSLGRPIAVGFGIHCPEDVSRLLAMGVDGVIIGTALVNAAAKGASAVHQLISSLAAAATFGR